jgi:hypothetical protein
VSDYRTVIGIVQFDPREGEAAGKPVRNIVVNQAGFKEQAVQVSATLWPSHADFEVAKNDIVVLEGKYTRTNSTKDGQPVVYNNISVARIGKIGEADAGVRVETDDNDVSDEPADEDIPF